MSHPANLKIYRITHISNLSSILQSGHIYSDAWMLKNSLEVKNIGMSEIKLRRLNDIEVSPSPKEQANQF